VKKPQFSKMTFIPKKSQRISLQKESAYIETVTRKHTMVGQTNVWGSKVYKM